MNSQDLGQLMRGIPTNLDLGPGSLNAQKFFVKNKYQTHQSKGSIMKLTSMMVNKGRIHGELGEFFRFF